MRRPPQGNDWPALLGDYEFRAFDAGRPAEPQFAAAPAGAGMYVLLAEDGSAIQYDGVEHLRARLAYHLAPEAGTATRSRRRRTDLSTIVRAILWRATGSRLERRLELLRVSRLADPAGYRTAMRLHPCRWVTADLTEAFPRLTATENPFELPDGQPTAGPIAERAATGAVIGQLEAALQLCRCRQSGASAAVRHDSCALWEMGKCPLPADVPAGAAEYRGLVAAGMAHLSGADGGALVAGLRTQMAEAAGALRFEEAGRCKARLTALEAARTGKVAGLVAAAECDRIVVLPAAPVGTSSATGSTGSEPSGGPSRTDGASVTGSAENPLGGKGSVASVPEGTAGTDHGRTGTREAEGAPVTPGSVGSPGETGAAPIVSTGWVGWAMRAGWFGRAARFTTEGAEAALAGLLEWVVSRDADEGARGAPATMRQDHAALWDEHRRRVTDHDEPVGVQGRTAPASGTETGGDPEPAGKGKPRGGKGAGAPAGLDEGVGRDLRADPARRADSARRWAGRLTDFHKKG